MKILGWCAFALLASLAICEIALRMAGTLDFPLFEAGPPYGYIPKHSQSGAFLHKNDWVFNERSMGTSRPFEASGDAVDTLLIGDSIVSGGNPYRQGQRLGPQLEERIGGRVWPISASSWSLRNELTYIRVNSDVARHIDRFIFIINSEDFAEASVWRSPLTHPTKRPNLALLYIIQKKLNTPPSMAQKSSPLPYKAWQEFEKNNHAPIFVIAYPNKVEAADPALRTSRLVEPLHKLMGPNTLIIDAGADPRWIEVKYRDNIHPTPEGTALLAKIISESLAKN